MKNFRLDENKISDGFAVPESYFEDFIVRIPESQAIRLNPWRHWAAVAAVLALALSIPALNQIAKQDVSPDALEQYLVMSQVHEEDLLNHLDQSDLNALSRAYRLESAVTEQAILNEDVENLIY